MKSIYVLLIALVACTFSCKTKNGEPGPAGASAGEALDKQGSISGTLMYLDYKGDTTYKPFTYAYYETLLDSKYDEIDGLNVSFSRRDLKDSEKYFSFGFTCNKGNNHLYEAPTYGSVDFSFVSLENNRLFSFSDYTDSEDDSEEVIFNVGSGTVVEITNFSFDKPTGRLIFDYKVTYAAGNISFEDKYDSTTKAIVSGHVDVVLNDKTAIQSGDRG